MTLVHLPSPLFAYTGGLACVEVPGATLREVLGALDALYPGLRFRIVDEQDRIRPTILFHVDGAATRTIDHPAGAEVHIVAALSGG